MSIPVLVVVHWVATFYMLTCLCVCYHSLYGKFSHFFRVQQLRVSGNMVLVLVAPEGSMAPLVSIVCVDPVNTNDFR